MEPRVSHPDDNLCPRCALTGGASRCPHRPLVKTDDSAVHQPSEELIVKCLRHINAGRSRQLTHELADMKAQEVQRREAALLQGKAALLHRRNGQR
jgi:hypothetical protein